VFISTVVNLVKVVFLAPLRLETTKVELLGGCSALKDGGLIHSVSISKGEASASPFCFQGKRLELGLSFRKP